MNAARRFRAPLGANRKQWAAALTGLACVVGLVRTLEPMHGERTGYREAGYWLAEHAQIGDDIDDPYTWTSYYSGRFFADSPPFKPGTGHCVYVVFEKSGEQASGFDAELT